MAQAKQRKSVKSRRSYSQEFKQEAVQMLLDGHSAPSVAQRLGLAGPNLLYLWKKQILHRAGPAARPWVLAWPNSKMSCGVWNANGTS